MTNNEIYFHQAQNKSGVEIALCESRYTTYIDANVAGFCMNRKGQVGNTIDSSLNDLEKTYGTNKGGYYSSYGGNTVILDYWRALSGDLTTRWGSYPSVYVDSIGQTNASSNAMKEWRIGVYLPSQVEIWGSTPSINPYVANYHSQWSWYGAGNRPDVKKSNDTSTSAYWWLRDPDLYDNTRFRLVETGSQSTMGCGGGYSAGFRPWLRFAGY